MDFLKKNRIFKHFSWSDKTRPLIGPTVLILFWWLMSVLDALNPFFIPSILDVINALLDLLTHHGLSEVWTTTGRTLLAFLIALFLAVPIGLLLATRPLLYAMTSGLIEFLRSIPAVSLFPLFLLIFGIGTEAKVAAAAFVAFWILLIQTIHAVWHIPVVRKQVGIVIRLSGWKKMVYLFIPQMLPELMTGFRIALSFSLILIVVSEMLMTTDGGMGAEILNSYLVFQTDRLYAAIILVGLLGYGMNKLAEFCERKTIHWAGR